MDSRHANFIWENREADPATLALSAKKHPDLDMRWIAAQVTALQKAARKLPSWYRHGIWWPPALSLEQSSSEKTAAFKAQLTGGGRVFADLTGGMGVDSQFLAKHFERGFYVEQREDLSAMAQHNFTALAVENTTVVHADAVDFLHQTTEQFDLIYLDPARRDDQKGKVFKLEDCTPNILSIKDLLLQKTPNILLKTSPMLDIRLAIAQIGSVQQVWVVSLDNDCREVLYWIGREPVPVEQAHIHAIGLHTLRPDDAEFDFQLSHETNAVPMYGSEGNYLYEPRPAVIKSGGYKTFATQYGLHKMHPSTHLYFSNQLVTDIPARAFEVITRCKYDKKTVASFVPTGKSNISTRNFPDTPEQVRKKLGLADGGHIYLFAATATDGQKWIWVTQKTGQTH